MKTLLTVALVFTAAAPAQTRRTLEELSESFATLAAKLAPSVVLVRCSAFAPEAEAAGAPLSVALRDSTGSGVVVSADGHIVTNAHVVAGATRIHVQFPPAPGEAGGSIVRPRGRIFTAKLTGVDRETDLALLKVDATGLAALPFADSDAVRQGQIVLALGNPLGLDNSITMGVISAVARQLRPDDPVIYLQTDAAVNPGNSGGPLVNLDGQIVGINTLIVSQSGGNEGLGFAVPSNIARSVVDQLSRKGEVTRGDIGVFPQTVTPGLAAGLSLARRSGVILADVAPGSPADNAGLQAGDLVLSLNGKPMENARQLRVNLYQQAVGSVIRIEIQRGAQTMHRDVVVTDRADSMTRFAAMVDSKRNLVPRLGIFGLGIDRKIGQLLTATRRSYGIVVVALASSPTAPVGLFQPGDVIYQVGTQPVSTLKELADLLDKIGAGETAVFQIEREGVLQYLEAILN